MIPGEPWAKLGTKVNELLKMPDSPVGIVTGWVNLMSRFLNTSGLQFSHLGNGRDNSSTCPHK